MKRTHTKINRGRIYLPTFALNLMPVVMHFTFMILLLIILIVFIQEGDWSWYSIKMNFVPSGILFGSLYMFWWFSYFLIRRSSAYVFVRDGVLLLKRKRKLEQFTIESIDYFSVVSTQSLAGTIIVKRELFLMDKTVGKRQLHHNDFGNNLRRSYEKFSRKLQDITGKEVRFANYVERLDGEILEVEEALEKEVEKSIPLFKSPYK